MQRSIGTALASVVVLAGCGDGSVTFEVIETRPDPSIECYRITAEWEGGERTDGAATIEELRLAEMEPGTYGFELESVASAGDSDCETGEPVGRARAFDVRIDRGQDVRVPLVLIPLNRLATLPVPSWVSDWFADRSDLAAATATRRSGGPVVVFSGGRSPDGAISRDLLLYEPRRADFTLLPDAMACSRAGHAAIAVGLDEDDQEVLLLGGDGECEGSSAAANRAEVFDPAERSTSFAPDPLVPLPRPVATRADAGSVLVMGSGRSDGAPLRSVVQRFDGVAFTEVLADARVPVSGGALTAIFPDGSGPYVVAGGRRADASLLTEVSLFAALDGSLGLEPCVMQGGTVEVSGDTVAATPVRSGGEVLLTGSLEEGGRQWLEIEPDSSCGHLQSVRGTLAVPRLEHEATALADGRVLLTGGDAAGTAELFLPPPSVGTTLPLQPEADPRLRSGHVAVPLEDGSVLLGGGGPREVEVLLPRAASYRRFLWDPQAEPRPTIDVLVVVSNSPEAGEIRGLLGSGGVLDDQGELRKGEGPASLIAAIAPLSFPDPDEFIDPNIQVAVTTGDMRCEDGDVGSGGLSSLCAETDSDPGDAQECILQAATQDHGCAAQELFRAMIAAAQDRFSARAGGRTDVPLLVLIAAPRDDCSSNDADVFDSSDVPLSVRCALEDDLYDPESVLEALATTRSNPDLVSVLTIGGPDAPAVDEDGSEVPPACADIRPTPRLAALSAAFGPRGHHVDLCATGGRPALTWWSEVVESRIGRRVCLPHAPVLAGSAEASCAVAWERDDAGGREALRLGYRYLPLSPGNLSEDTSQCAHGVLEVQDPLAIPIGEKVLYACQ